MKKNAIIFSGGDVDGDPLFYKRYIHKDDYIVCADSGAEHVLKLGLFPSAVLGDMDSIKPETLKKLKEQNVNIIKYKSEKDYTDTELAIKYALEIKPNEIIIFGAIGDRIDHSLANIQLLIYILSKGYNARIINRKNEAVLINKSVVIKGEKGTTISLIPLTEKVRGVVTKNLYYPLKNETLTIGTTRGISNVMTNDEANITIKTGLLLIIKILHYE